MSVVDSHMILGSGGAWWDQGMTRTVAGKPTETPRQVKFEPAQVLAECDRANIDRACVMSPINTEYGAANRLIADACEKYPDRLIGFAVHSPEREEGRLKRMLREEVLSMGLKAVRSDGPPSRELLDVARDLGIPVIYSPVVQRTEDPVRAFYMITQYYPEVNFILPHMGRYSPDFFVVRRTPDFIARQDNMFFDTSATMFLKYLERAARVAPIEKMLFGSCGPHLDARVARETIRLLELPGEQESKVLGGNILGLLKL